MLFAGGCANELDYRGVSPSMRTFADRPELSDYYVGMNMNFAVLDPEQRRQLDLDRQAQLAAGRSPAQIRQDEMERNKQPGLQPDSPSTIGPPDLSQ